MKHRFSLFLRLLSFAFGAFMSSAAIASDAPLVTANVTTITTAKQIMAAQGPLDVNFRISVANRSERPVTLTRIEVFTDDDSGFTVENGSRNVHTTIPSETVTATELIAHAIAPDGLQRDEPLQVRVRLQFTDATGKFTKEFSEFIP